MALCVLVTGQNVEGTLLSLDDAITGIARIDYMIRGMPNVCNISVPGSN